MPVFSQFGKLMNFSHANVSARGFVQLKDSRQITSVFALLSESVNIIQGKPQSAIS